MKLGQHLLRSLRNAKVAVVHPNDEDGKNLVLQLRRIGCQVQSIWPVPDQLEESIDVVFFDIEPESSLNFDWLGDERRYTLIAMITYENPVILDALTRVKVHGVVTKPIRPLDVLAHLVTALSLFKYEKRLNARIMKLDETLKTRRFVERAMRILRKNRNLTEDEAYKLIRREAMNKQITLFEMANSIINADIFLSS